MFAVCVFLAIHFGGIGAKLAALSAGIACVVLVIVILATCHPPTLGLPILCGLLVATSWMWVLGTFPIAETNTPSNTAYYGFSIGIWNPDGTYVDKGRSLWLDGQFRCYFHSDRDVYDISFAVKMYRGESLVIGAPVHASIEKNDVERWVSDSWRPLTGGRLKKINGSPDPPQMEWTFVAPKSWRGLQDVSVEVILVDPGDARVAMPLGRYEYSVALDSDIPMRLEAYAYNQIVFTEANYGVLVNRKAAISPSLPGEKMLGIALRRTISRTFFERLVDTFRPSSDS